MERTLAPLRPAVNVDTWVTEARGGKGARPMVLSLRWLAMADPAEFPSGTVFAGRYRIERRVDAKVSHDVYFATRPDGRYIVLKLMRGTDRSAEARRRFLQEANDASTLEGARVSEAVETGDDPARGPFVAMLWPATSGAPAPRKADLRATVEMSPSRPPPSAQGDDYLRTVGMAPAGGPPEDVKLARGQLEEAARVEAMMKAPRVHPTMPPKKPRNGFLIAAILLAVLGIGAAAFYWMRKPAPPPPVNLPIGPSSSSSK